MSIPGHHEACKSRRPSPLPAPCEARQAGHPSPPAGGERGGEGGFSSQQHRDSDGCVPMGAGDPRPARTSAGRGLTGSTSASRWPGSRRTRQRRSTGSRTRGAQEAENLPPTDGEGNPVHRSDVPDALRQPLHLDGGRRSSAAVARMRGKRGGQPATGQGIARAWRRLPRRRDRGHRFARSAIRLSTSAASVRSSCR